MTDGGESVTVLSPYILERLPLSADQCFQRELPNPLTIADILLCKETVHGCWALEVDDGYIAVLTDFSLLGEVFLKHFVNHLLEGDATQAVVGMDATIRRNGEVKQQGGVSAH